MYYFWTLNPRSLLPHRRLELRAPLKPKFWNHGTLLQLKWSPVCVWCSHKLIQASVTLQRAVSFLLARCIGYGLQIWDDAQMLSQESLFERFSNLKSVCNPLLHQVQSVKMTDGLKIFLSLFKKVRQIRKLLGSRDPRLWSTVIRFILNKDSKKGMYCAKDVSL